MSGGNCLYGYVSSFLSSLAYFCCDPCMQYMTPSHFPSQKQLTVLNDDCKQAMPYVPVKILFFVSFDPSRVQIASSARSYVRAAHMYRCATMMCWVYGGPSFHCFCFRSLQDYISCSRSVGSMLSIVCACSCRCPAAPPSWQICSLPSKRT